MNCGIEEVIDIKEIGVDMTVYVFECNEAIVNGVINGKWINKDHQISNHLNSCKGVK